MGHNIKLDIFIKLFYCLVLLYMVLQNPLFFIFIGFHEVGHLCSGIILGYKIKKLTLLPFGFSLCFKEAFIKPRDNIIISIFGPLTNLIFFAVFLIVYLIFPSYNMFKLVGINLVLFIFNLIPVGFLDGGRIVKEIMSMYISIYLANLIINLNGIIFGCIMLILSLYYGLTISSIVLFLIGISLLISSIIQIKWIKMSIIKEILYKRFKKDKSYKFTRTKCYDDNTKIFDIMKNFSFNISCSIVDERDMSISDKDIISYYFTKGNLSLKECFDEHRRNIDVEYKR